MYYNADQWYTFPLSKSIVPINQSVMQSDDDQPRQDDESSPVEHTNGLYNTHVDIVWYDIACLVHLVVIILNLVFGAYYHMAG